MNEAERLWQPTQQQIERTQMHALMNRISEKYDVTILLPRLPKVDLLDADAETIERILAATQ